MLYLLMSLFLVIQGFSCTNFSLENEEKKYVVGRSMEFATLLNSSVIISPKGGKEKSMIGEKQGLTWTQKYAYIGMDALKNERFIIDGVNEEGLSFGGLWLPETKYPEVSMEKMDEIINLQDMGRWLLGSFSTVKEAVEGLKKVEIYAQSEAALGQVPTIHIALQDAKGNGAVIEFLDGKMEISENIVGVLTNSPKFSWQVTNLDNYVNLSSLNAGSVKLDGTVLSQTGQGSGLLGMPGDWTPPSRFIKITLLKNFVKKAPTQKWNANLAIHLLNTVDIPYGGVKEGGGKGYDYTQWIVVKDLDDQTFYWRTYKNLNIQSINLNKEKSKGFQKIAID